LSVLSKGMHTAPTPRKGPKDKGVQAIAGTGQRCTKIPEKKAIALQTGNPIKNLRLMTQEDAKRCGYRPPYKCQEEREGGGGILWKRGHKRGNGNKNFPCRKKILNEKRKPRNESQPSPKDGTWSHPERCKMNWFRELDGTEQSDLSKCRRKNIAAWAISSREVGGQPNNDYFA